MNLEKENFLINDTLIKSIEVLNKINDKLISLGLKETLSFSYNLTKEISRRIYLENDVVETFHKERSGYSGERLITINSKVKRLVIEELNYNDSSRDHFFKDVSGRNKIYADFDRLLRSTKQEKIAIIDGINDLSSKYKVILSSDKNSVNLIDAISVSRGTNEKENNSSLSSFGDFVGKVKGSGDDTLLTMGIIALSAIMLSEQTSGEESGNEETYNLDFDSGNNNDSSESSSSSDYSSYIDGGSSDSGSSFGD